MIQLPDTIPYERKYRDDVLSLMFYSRRVHTHLDWYKAGQWLDMPHITVQLAFHDDELVGVLGISEAIGDATWIRIATVARAYNPAVILGAIWEAIQPRLAANNIKRVSALLLHNWLASYLPAMRFDFLEDVVTMHRTGYTLADIPKHKFTIRNSYLEDVDSIMTVDHAAFDTMWQLSKLDIRHAIRHSNYATVVEDAGRIVGYQTATRHQNAGHLARIAVHPAMQGKKVGAILLHHLLSKFNSRGVKSVTVNTQLSNVRSQQLYRNFGFIRNGFDFPVWSWQNH